ncbi:putative fatty acid desaturase [Moritella sp. PE36]|uniref:fatty acid desaturase family protein n=1 Tax=Moritella sp. PE36 TaxID=58051 RepID=UPI0001568887|nr:acyl-CoA desaturase [Moritella sp. PE36]EDM69249.1 putative fatty acid desaturase [Moritella sp. PE36]
MAKLNEQQLEQLAIDLDAVKARAMKEVGSVDERYIKKIIRLQRTLEISGRICLVLGFLSLYFWGVGVLLLSASKILDNMEIGHNVLHGQYDWMNDPTLNSQTFEWDIACSSESWKRVHNYEHHTYTNIVGKDRDFGYGLLRLSDDFSWRLRNLWQFGTYLVLSALFQWGIAFHEMAGERVFFGKRKASRESHVDIEHLKKVFYRKSTRQILKDYVIFPALAGPFFVMVLLGNIAANLIRNFWTSTVIFCGHFPTEVYSFTEKECENESRGHWYYRQILGSANLTGPKWFHILTGHLSCQVEHHLFPEVPAHRYVAMSKEVQAITAKYGIAYNTGNFFSQYTSVLRRVIYFSFPVGKVTGKNAALYPRL